MRRTSPSAPVLTMRMGAVLTGAQKLTAADGDDQIEPVALPHHLARAEHLDQAREAGDRVAVLAARTEAAAAQVYKL